MSRAPSGVAIARWFAWTIDALKAVGCHTPDCGAYKVIGRFGSRTGLRWCEGDLGRCSCRLGSLIFDASEARSEGLEPSLRKVRGDR